MGHFTHLLPPEDVDSLDELVIVDVVEKLAKMQQLGALLWIEQSGPRLSSLEQVEVASPLARTQLWRVSYGQEVTIVVVVVVVVKVLMVRCQAGEVQVWSLTQFYSVGFSQSRIRETKVCFLYKHIKGLLHMFMIVSWDVWALLGTPYADLVSLQLQKQFTRWDGGSIVSAKKSLQGSGLRLLQGKKDNSIFPNDGIYLPIQANLCFFLQKAERKNWVNG